MRFVRQGNRRIPSRFTFYGMENKDMKERACRRLPARILRILLIAAAWVILAGPVRAEASVSLSRKSRNLKYRTSFTLTVKGAGQKTVTWSSSDTSIASVKRTGKTTAKIYAKKKYGSAVITAQVEELTLSCRVNVSKTGKMSKARSTIAQARKKPFSGGKWSSGRYRDKNGWYLTDTFAKIGKYFYYFGSDSKRVIGIFDLDGYTFLADKKGRVAVNCTKTLSGGSCYAFDKSGHMVKDREIVIKKKHYYYGSNGVQVRQQMVGTRYYNAKGQRLFDLSVEFARPMSSKDLSSYDYLYVGASKPYAMGQKAMPLDDRIFFNCSGGATISFFFSPHKGVEPLLPVIRKYLTQRPDGIVISEMSGNDLENLSGYIAIYKAIQAEFPQARLALLDMLPGEKGVPKNITRQCFNAVLHETFGPWNPVSGGCLYGYEHLYSQENFRTLDGTHYPDDMKRVTYEYVMKALGRPVEIEYTTVNRTTERWTAINELSGHPSEPVPDEPV